jgi:sulfatase maturation enzyme AslB (radical SAM superfamily)
MKLPHDKFCVLPWISLETSPTGTVRPCCLAVDEIPNDQGVLFNLADAKFSDIQKSEYMQDLREQFLMGQQPSTCQRCWAEEDAGRVSKRMNTLRRLKHVIDHETWSKDAKPLLFLDLKLGNICNLKCRICGSWSSSTYASEQLQFVPLKERRQNYHYQMLRRGAWPRASDVFWQQLDQHMDDIRYLEFTGGEPFMIREHFDLLRTLRDRGLASRVEIHYNTNGTIFPEEAADIWPHFRHVEIAFSIDALGAAFEYQRSNAVWTEVKHNIHRFQELKQRSSNMSLQVCSTISVFNVLEVPELSAWVAEQAFDFVYWNVLHEPSCYSLHNLPARAKDLARASLDHAAIPDRFRDEFQQIIEFMGREPQADTEQLCRLIRDLDIKRDQDFAKISPAMAEAIGYQRD